MSEFEVSNWSFGDALVRTLRTLQKGTLNERTLSDENVWFVAKDVAAALEYRTADDMTRYLDDDEIIKCPVQTSGGVQEMIVISESGLYHAIFQSRKEAAKAFRRWVTSEVLPQIRRTGGYTLSEFVDRVSDASASYGGIAKLLREVSVLHKQGVMNVQDAKAAAVSVFESAGIPLLSLRERIVEMDSLSFDRNDVNRFIDEMLVRSESSTSWRTLYGTFCEWAGYQLDEFGIPEEHGALTQRMFTARMKKAVGLEGENADVIFMDGKAVRGLKHWSIRAAEEKLPSGCIPEGNIKEIILDESVRS